MVVLPSVENLAYMLRKCSLELYNNSNGFLHLFYAYLHQCGRAAHTLLGNQTMETFGQNDLKKLASQNELWYDSLITSYIQNAQWKDAFELCVKLPLGSLLHLDKRAFVFLLKACASLRQATFGCRIHAHLGSKETDIFVGTALIDMYAKCGMLEKTRDIFDKLIDRDVVTWNALISGYAQHACGEEALECYEKMQVQGICPDSVTFACTLKACGSIGAKIKGAQIHADVERRGLFGNTIVGNALVDMYAKCGSLTKARDVFNMLPFRNVVTWTALIGGYAQYNQGQEALNCFEQMKSQGLSPDAITYACCLKACGSLGAVDIGTEMHADIERQRSLKRGLLVSNALIDMYAKCGFLVKAQEVFDMLPIRDVISWTALISGYVQQDQGEEAIECFEKMKVQDVLPNDVTFSCIMKACGAIGALDKGKEIHAEIEQKGLLKRSQLIGNALVDMYAKCGMLVKAREVFDNLPVRDVVSWTVLITGYAQVGDFNNVLAIFDRMLGEGMKPNLVTFVGILNVCSHSGLIDMGLSYIEAMNNEYGLMPTLEHHTCIVDILGRAGQIDKALRVMKRMPSYPNIVLWLTILGACKKWGNVELGRHAFEQALLLDEKETSAYVSMYNISIEFSIQASDEEVEAMRLKRIKMEAPNMLFVD